MSTDSTPALDQAERLLTEKDYAGAIALARNELASGSQQARALFICAEGCARTGATAEAEAAYRQALAMQPSMQRARFGLVSLLRTSDRNEEALALVRELLTEQQAHVYGLQSLCDLLFALGRPEEASAYLREAEALAPSDPQLQLLVGEWLVRSGTSVAQGVARLRRALEQSPANPAAWIALIREAGGRGDFDSALELGARAVAACPAAVWVWELLLLMLSAAGREQELALEIASRAAPPVHAPQDFLRWANLMQRVEFPLRAWAAWQSADEASQEAFLKTREGAELIAKLSRAQGLPLVAIRSLRFALEAAPSDPRLLRQLFDLALCAGDAPLAGEMASRLHQTNPFNHGGLEMFLLHETRIFPDAMRQVQEAIQGDPSQCLAGLSRAVLDEPGCLPAAIAWLNRFKAERCAERPVTGTCIQIPRNLYIAEDLSAEWRVQHEEFKCVDLRTRENELAAKKLLPVRIANAMRRHPRATANDVLRLASLHATGGWWVNAYGRCGASLENLCTADSAFVGHLNDKGLLSTEFIGVVAGSAAMNAALDVACTALLEIAPRGNSSQLVSGPPALTLGFARSAAGALLDGEAPQATILTFHQRQRLLKLAWPG